MMSETLRFVALLLTVLVSCPGSETANVTAFIRNSSSPSYAVEGQSFTLEWTYTLDGTVGYVQFSIITRRGSELVIGKKFGPGVITVEPAYQAQFTAQATNTRAELHILAVQKSDETTYRVNIVPSGSGGPLSQFVLVIVLFPPTITDISENQAVTEGGNVTLKCLAEGKPTPNITWARLSDNRVVNMPLTEIRRQDAGKYRCTADNGVGNPPTGDVLIVVQYPPEVNGIGHNATVAGGAEHTFSCPVDGNPVPSITWYNKSGAYSGKQFKTRQSGCYICAARNIHGTSDNITQCLIIKSSLPTVSSNTDHSQTMVSSITVSGIPSQMMVSSTTASQGGSSSSTASRKAGPPWIIVIAVAGGVVLLAILVGVLTWWVHKQRKYRKDTKIHNSDLGRHNDEGEYSQVQGAYAQSGPPAASGTDGAIGQEIEVAAVIPTYAVVDKSKKKKNKKLREEVPPVYAEVDKSKKKKKKVDDKNLYETLEEPKKARKPGELLYADLGDFQNPGMSPVSISPQPLPAIKIPEPYERTDYADITQFHKGNAKMPNEMPQNDGNEDTEMKPKRPSKKKIQGNANETGI